jgi:SAM-dependent methyltransferase
VTRAIELRIATARGLAIDVGGGREAAHDRAWHPSVHRIRLDLSALHGPDLRADASALPMEDESVDVVLMVQVLEHLSDPERACHEAWRVLKPEGLFVGSVPFVYPVHGDPHDYYRFSEDGLRHILRSFEIVDIEPLGSALSGAWLLLASRSRIWRLLNPVMRGVGNKADPRSPESYVFTARK